jgi:hypothetical protein
MFWGTPQMRDIFQKLKYWLKRKKRNLIL